MNDLNCASGVDLLMDYLEEPAGVRAALLDLLRTHRSPQGDG
jgi:hypothetical protein